MEVSVTTIGLNERQILENLYQYYVCSLSKVADIEVSESGRFQFNRNIFNPYFTKPTHVPYVIKVGQSLAGFALVRRYPADTNLWDIEQYFVLPKYKGKGVGKKAFELLVCTHLGRWQLRVLKENQNALYFWLSAIRAVTKYEPKVTTAVDEDLEMDFIYFEVVG